MNNLLKILHINPSWEVVYILIGDGIFVKSNIPLEEAIPMLKNDNFDLILSEPQNIAILDHPTDSGKKNLFDKKLVLNGRDIKQAEKAVKEKTGRKTRGG